MPQSKTPHLRFKGFNGEWEEKKIGDVVDDLYNGQTPSRIINNYWNGKINWLSSGELNRSIVKKTVEKISVSGQKSANLRLVPSGTFVIAITGLEATGTRGNCAILGIDTTLNQSCMAIYPNLNLLLTSFLFQWYRKNSEEYGIKFTQGTKQQSYNAAIIKKLDIVLPKVEEQNKIGEYFQRLDALIEQKEKKYQKLKQFKTAMLSQLFPKEGEHTPKLRFKGFSEEWEEGKISELGIFNPKAEIPEKFEYVDLESVVGTKMISHRIEHKSTAPSRAQRLAIQGDLFYQTVRPYQKNNYLFNQSYKNYVFSTGYAQIRPYANGSFLLSLVQNDRFVKDVLNNCTGTSYPAINSKDLANIDVYYPSKTEQTKIGNYFQKLDTLIDLHQQELEKLKTMKKALLAKMFV